MTTKTVLVAGATGATGRLVVQQLLDQGNNVRVVARSKDRMMSLLKEGADYGSRIQVTEASLLDLPSSKLEELTKDCDAIVSCLGHNITFKGMYAKPRQLVTQAVERLTTAASPSTRFILMGSNGVHNPSGDERKRPAMEGAVIFLIRHLVPPHKDNEMAAAYLVENLKPDGGKSEWAVVRPGDLIDTDVTEYELHKQSPNGPFSDGAAARANVADFMVRLIQDDALWKEWKYQMPVILNKKEEAATK